MENNYRPKYGEEYFTVRWIWNKCISVFSDKWTDTERNQRNLKTGNCFKTLHEATENQFLIYKKITGKDWPEEEKRGL